MGIIKDGSISGILPSSQAFAVYYPGYPSTMERAIQTLGGTERILKSRSLQSNKLELHFRPEDPYSHPAFGELHPCDSFLLKISSKKDGVSEIAEETNQTLEHLSDVKEHTHDNVQENLSANIVAKVSEVYHFKGMADYQHVVPVHADIARKKKSNWVGVEPEFEEDKCLNLDQEDLMILAPPLFSSKDIPEKVVLKPSVDLSLKKKHEGIVQNRWEMDIEPSLAIDFNIKEIPKKVDWEKYIPQGSGQWELQMIVCRLFEERPIWVKDSLVEHLLNQGLNVGGNMLRRLLFRTAYYFSNGPFLRFWIRKGYDPRKDPESRIYQRIDFRVPPTLRSYSDANTADGLNYKWEDICAFRVFPYKCQTSLQLIELADDYIQREIRKPAHQSSCSCTTGWFSAHILHSLRLGVAVRFLSIYPKAGAEYLLKSAFDRFEKSKRIQILTKCSKPDEEAQEEIGTEEKELDDNSEDEDEDEDDEIEDDNVDEKLDAYGALGQVPDDSSFSPQRFSYKESENISKNYLQELFGCFPFSEAGGIEFQDADNSVGEYQIYEQFSDGYSDDD